MHLNATTAAPSERLLRNPNFLRLWVARGLSQTGTALTATVIPLVAAVSLGASAGQMGFLVVAGMLPAVVVAVPVSVWADRVEHLIPTLILCDLTRAAMVGLIPLLWWRNALTFGVLVAVAIARSVVSAVYSTCSSPVVVKVVAREQLIDANGKLSATSSAASVAGPSAGAGLLALLAAPVVLLFDAASFVFSAGITAFIRTYQAPGQPGPVEDRPPAATATPQLSSTSQLIAVGRRVVARADVRTVVTIAFVNGIAQALAVLFFLHDLRLSISTLSLLAGLGAVGGVAAGTLVGNLTRRWGQRRLLVVGYLLTLWSLVVLPFGTAGAVGVLVALNLNLTGSFGATLIIVTVFGDLQAAAEKGSVARVMAFASTLLQAAVAAGALLGGTLGSSIGIRNTLGLAAAVLTGLLLPRTVAWSREWRSADAG